MTAITTQLSSNSGTKTADGTEQTLGSTTSLATGANLQLEVNTKNMVDGDTLELRVYTNDGVNAADEPSQFASFSNTQGDTIKRADPIAVEAGGRYKATLKQTAGTNRDYYWKVMQL
jgi:hypothetical protein